ncbi:NYN domain-containing protein [Leucobacter sp. HY1910]
MPQASVRIALLIDADNVSASHIAAVLIELTRYGTTSVRRMYGDWTSGNLRGWKEAANEHSIQPMQQFAYTAGKNSTDSALIIDAMDLLHQNQLDAFAIISSDSDFTRLAARLRESGAQVYGFGARTTPKPFVNACDAFTYLDVLDVTEIASGAPAVTAPAGPKEGADLSSTPGTETPQLNVPVKAPTNQLRMDTKLVRMLRTSIAAGADGNGWAGLSAVGSNMRKQAPDFDPRNWGYGKLSELIEALGLMQLRRVSAKNGGTNLEVRVPTKS